MPVGFVHLLKSLSKEKSVNRSKACSVSDTAFSCGCCFSLPSLPQTVPWSGTSSCAATYWTRSVPWYWKLALSYFGGELGFCQVLLGLGWGGADWCGTSWYLCISGGGGKAVPTPCKSSWHSLASADGKDLKYIILIYELWGNKLQSISAKWSCQPAYLALFLLAY